MCVGTDVDICVYTHLYRYSYFHLTTKVIYHSCLLYVYLLLKITPMFFIVIHGELCQQNSRSHITIEK